MYVAQMAGSRDPGYGITLVDFAAELFGLSTLWLGPDFYKNNTDHWPSSASRSSWDFKAR
jgi:hypothetical protein